MNWMSVVLLAALFALAAWFSPQLPDPVPTHWNLSGEADGWIAKPWGVWLLPLVCAFGFGLLLFLPVIAPRGFRLESARKSYDVIVLLVLMLIAAITVSGWQSSLGADITLERLLPYFLGGFFIFFGNYLAKFPKNFFVGIRTPWTLASDEVWRRTHRLGGWLFTLAGVAGIAAGLLKAPLWVAVAAVIIVAIVSALYSLLLYRRLHGFGRDDDSG
jgi:uncharacterized membrane protein